MTYKELSFVEYHLDLSRELYTNETSLLRGFFGNKFIEEVILHHHKPDGTLLYSYPRVQFKIFQKKGHLIGLEEGCDLLSHLWKDTDYATIGKKDVKVLHSSIQRKKAIIGSTLELVTYKFLTPWVALNQNNFRKYHECKYQRERTALLNNILVGNCISFSKSFNYEVLDRLVADCSNLRTASTRLKGTKMIGFVGKFRVNFLLPDLIGIGKSVSRGFGTIARLNETKT